MNANLRRALIPALAFLCAFGFVAQVHWRPAQFALLAEIKADAPARIQLRYNRGYGVRQEGISAVNVEAGKFVRVRFPIEVNTAQDLRLLNLGFGHNLEIRSLALKPLVGAARNFTFAEVSSQTPNTEITQAVDGIQVTSSGMEPLVLHLDRGTRIEAPPFA